MFKRTKRIPVIVELIRDFMMAGLLGSGVIIATVMVVATVMRKI